MQIYLTGAGSRFDGAELSAADWFELPSGTISTQEFSHLFSVFDGSRVHQQAEKKPSHDDALPGMYFTVIRSRLIQSQYKNRAGLVTEEVGTTDLYIESLHVDAGPPVRHTRSDVVTTYVGARALSLVR